MSDIGELESNIKILMIMLSECAKLVIENDSFQTIRNKIQPLLINLNATNLEAFFKECKKHNSTNILYLIDMDDLFLSRNCKELCQYMLDNFNDYLDVYDLEDKLMPYDTDEVNTDQLWKLEMIQEYIHKRENNTE